MNNMKQWTFTKHLVFSLALTILVILSSIISNSGLNIFRLRMLHKVIPFFGLNQASSIGIIGGTDGPTAIYTTTKLFHFELNKYLILFIVLLVLYKPFKYILYKIFAASNF